MGEADQQPAGLKLSVMGLESGEPTTVAEMVTDPRTRRMWWIRVSMYIAFVIAGQSAATLLGRLYYAKGGNSKWMASLVECGGFPVLIPLYILTKKNSPPANSNSNSTSHVSLPILTLAYTVMGILIAGFSLLYSVGLMYLPVSTYSLISASQLGFNALFSFFINSQKITTYILNSLVLLTLSSILLVFENPSSSESAQSGSSRRNFAIGFLSTVGASVGYGLLLTLTEFFFEKVVRRRTFKVVVDVLVYPPAVASAAVVAGLFGSGEWKGIGKEMEGFELGKASYVMTLVWTAVCWQVFSIGCVGLIFEVSSLFSNVIGTFGLPVVPILAVVCFRDEMGGLKVIAMVLAVWGFVSYLYQHYLDDREDSGSKFESDGGRSSGEGDDQETLGEGLLV
ncbi:unnamed protein product [Linum trigynum]|uniref:Probable purine permease n=1 Tax=Linum trigynum TaxID=586398 RepID=A0AAV2FXW2_9ROSI